MKERNLLDIDNSSATLAKHKDYCTRAIIVRRCYLTASLIIAFTLVYVLSDYANLQENLHNGDYISVYQARIENEKDNSNNNQKDNNNATMVEVQRNYYYNQSDNLTQTRVHYNAPPKDDFDVSPVRWYSVPVDPDPNDRWTILVTSAYYDHRIDKVVVLLASDAAGLLKREGTKYTFTCVLFYNSEFNDNNSVIEVEGYFYTSYIFYCPLTNVKTNNISSSIEIPTRLTIYRNDSLDSLISTNWTVPIDDLLERKNHSKPRGLLALCVGIMFGYQDWLTLLQYIEFHRIQGVEKFVFFYHDMHWSTEIIFRYYTSKFNFIELVEWNPAHTTCRNDYRCQLLRDNFCSYSLMYKYKYVGNTDFDELFFPLQGKLTDLLKLMDRPDRGSFQFRAKYHQTLTYDTPQWENVTYANISEAVKKFLPLLHYHNVSTFAGHFYSPKTITKPETVLKRWIHYVATHTKGTALYLVNATSEGYMRHFKIRKWWGHWAENADQEVKYKLVNSDEEVGKPLLDLVMKNVQTTAVQIKLFNDEDAI